MARLRRNAILCREGAPLDGVSYLVTGAAVVRKADIRGRAVAVQLATPGAIFGFRDMVAESDSHSVTVQCAVDSLVCRLPLAVAAQAFAGDRGLERLFMDRLARELNGMQNRALQMVSLKVRDRLLVLIEGMATAFGASAEGGAWVVGVPVSRIDMAALAGMTPESLSRCIRELEDAGLAHFSRHRVVLPSRDRVRAILDSLGVEA